MPFEPSDQRIVRTEARSSIKIAAGDQCALWPRPVDRDVDQAIDRLIGAGLVVLADPNHASPYGVNHAVCIAQTSWLPWGFCDRDRPVSPLLPVQALVGVVAGIDNASADQIRAATIFMDPVAHVERRWPALRHRRRDIRLPAIQRAADDDRPSLLLRATFDPIDVAAVDRDSAETDRRRDDQIRGDRRSPRPIRGGPQFSHAGYDRLSCDSSDRADRRDAATPATRAGRRGAGC